MLIPSHQGFQRDNSLEKLLLLIKGNVSIEGQKQWFFPKTHQAIGNLCAQANLCIS